MFGLGSSWRAGCSSATAQVQVGGARVWRAEVCRSEADLPPAVLESWLLAQVRDLRAVLVCGLALVRDCLSGLRRA